MVIMSVFGGSGQWRREGESLFGLLVVRRVPGSNGRKASQAKRGDGRRGEGA